MSDIHTRIRDLRNKANLSMEALAAQVGVSWQTIQQWENGKTAPKRARLSKVAAIFRVSEQYLVAGEDTASDSAHMPIQMVDAKASAGEGHLVLSRDVSSELMFRRDWLAKRGVRATEDALAFEVSGDSVVDACIPDGSIVLANRKQTEPVPKGMFVLWLGGQLYLKQLVQEGGRWVARSRNKERAGELPDIPVEVDDRIEGRVFWCGFGL